MKGQLDWIKVNINSFDDNKIKLISSMPHGDSIICIWFRLLFEAGKSNDDGYIYVNEFIPYTLEMLSKVFNRPKKIIEQALTILKDFMMIEIDEDNYIKIKNWDLYQSVDRLKEIKREKGNERTRRCREKKKLKEKEIAELEAAAALDNNTDENVHEDEIESVTCNADCNVTCNTENVTVTDKIKSNKEKKIEIEKEKKEIEKDTACNKNETITLKNFINTSGVNPGNGYNHNIDDQIEDMISENKSNKDIAEFLHMCYKERYDGKTILESKDIAYLIDSYPWKRVKLAMEIGIVSGISKCDDVEKILKRWEEEKREIV